MTTKRSNALPLAIAAITAGLLTSSCRNTGERINDHWNFTSVTPSMVRAATGYDATLDGDPSNFWSRTWAEFRLSTRRYMLNSNPYNPNQVQPANYSGKTEIPEIPPNPYNGPADEDSSGADSPADSSGEETASE